MVDLAGVKNLASDASDFIGSNSGLLQTVGIAAGGAVVGGAIVGAIAASSSKKSKKRSSSKKKYKKSSKRRKSRKQKQPHTAGKRKDTSHRRIRYTKNNQPYVIMSSGKARFISKSSAKRSKKRTSFS